MPFWKKDNGKAGKNKEKVNYKARLEHKQYLAQESPDSVYDLTDCGLKTVPPGVFSRIKVLRKEALLLQENELVSLSGGGNLPDLAGLQVLDLHNNCLEKLPEELGQLTGLQALHLQDNRLKQLPGSLGNLKNLQTLNLAGNAFKELPKTFEGLTRLKTLNLSANSKLSALPSWLGRLQGLKSLTLDTATLTYPSSDITSQGTEAVMKFLASELGIVFVPPHEYVAAADTQTNGKENGVKQAIRDPYEDLIKNHLEMEEKRKASKKEQAACLEREMVEAADREAQLQLHSQKQKRALLNSMAEEENRKDEEMLQWQRLREEEKKELNSRMTAAEQQSDVLIKELMVASQRYSDPAKVMQALEEDKRAMEQQLQVVAGDAEKLREKEVMWAMKMMMEEEMAKKATLKRHEERQGVIRSALTSSLEDDRAVEEALASKGKQQEELIGKMLEEEKYQREAFQALLLQQDHRALEISDQLSKIQNELAALTTVEMQKRDMKVEFERELMAEKREQLTKLLLDLMEKKQKRAEDLQVMMQEMEVGKAQDQENYWLIQYQKLLDSKPASLTEAEHQLDTQVRDLLAGCGAEEFIPVFAKRNITFKQFQYMEDKELKELGMTSEYLRSRLRSAVEEGVAARSKLGGTESIATPSAPPPSLDESAPSAPALDNTDPSAPSAPSAPAAAPVITAFHSPECVICLDKKSCIILLPCGHLCVCAECNYDLAECPLCRAAILTRVNI